MMMQTLKQTGWLGKNFAKFLVMAGGVCSLVPQLGCGSIESSPPTAQVDKESNLGESVSTLEQTFTKIATAFAGGDPESVHDELHDTGHLLEQMEKQVKAGEQVKDGMKESAAQAMATLFEGFTTLDDSLHDAEDADIDSAKAKISAALIQLKEALK
jgi:hypothetical protein